MAETNIEKYRRLIEEAKAIEPKPSTPIEGMTIDPGEKGGVTITTNGEGQEIDVMALRHEAKKGLVFPTITLTDEQMDGLCTYWAKAKEEAKAFQS